MISGCSLREVHISASLPAKCAACAGRGQWNSLEQNRASLHRLGGFLELEKLVLDFLGVGFDFRDDCLGLVPGEIDAKARKLRGEARGCVAPRKRDCSG